jgi:alkylation response protein AidB-like acyl-CoA dehydrogenase
MERTIFNEEQILQERAAWVDREIVPLRTSGRRPTRPRELWKSGGAQGYPCPWLEEQHGGPGADSLCSVIVIESLRAPELSGVAFSLHSDVVVPYIHTSAPTLRSNTIYRAARRDHHRHRHDRAPRRQRSGVLAHDSAA